MMEQEPIHIYELYTISYKPWWHSPWPWIVLTVILLLIAIIAGFFYYFLIFKKRTKPSWQDALEKLAVLKPELYQEYDDHKIFYTKLTIILKNYFALTYEKSLLSKTDNEIIHALKNYLPEEIVRSLSIIMRGAVIIKFSNKTSAQDQMRYDLKRAVEIVRLSHKYSSIDNSL